MPINTFEHVKSLENSEAPERVYLSHNCKSAAGNATYKAYESLTFENDIGYVKESMADRLAEALTQILANDGHRGSECYHAIKLYEAREMGRVALNQYQKLKG